MLSYLIAEKCRYPLAVPWSVGALFVFIGVRKCAREDREREKREKMWNRESGREHDFGWERMKSGGKSSFLLMKRNNVRWIRAADLIDQDRERFCNLEPAFYVNMWIVSSEFRDVPALTFWSREMGPNIPEIEYGDFKGAWNHFYRSLWITWDLHAFWSLTLLDLPI